MTTPEDTPLYGKTNGLFFMSSLPTHIPQAASFPAFVLTISFCIAGEAFLEQLFLSFESLYVFGFADLGFFSY